MQSLLILLLVSIFIFFQAQPAFCTSMTFHICVTIPEHVVTGSLSNNANQLVQKQTVIRNNQTISMTSIVVP